MATYKGLTVELGADTKNLTSALRDASKGATQTARELKEVERALKLNPNEVRLTTRQMELLEEQVSQATKRLEVLKSRRYRTGFIVVGILQAVLIGLSVLMPLYVQNVLGFSATISGLATLPGAVLGAAMGLFAGRVFDKSGVRGIAIAGAIVLTAGSRGDLTATILTTDAGDTARTLTVTCYVFGQKIEFEVSAS